MAGVVLENVSRRYPPQLWAVRDVDLEVRDQEFLVVVGPSGCGKTTLLRLIAGLEAPTSGRVRIGSRVVNDVPPRDRDIAMVFQTHALHPNLNVYRNLAFGIELREGLCRGGWCRAWYRVAGRWLMPPGRRQLHDARMQEIDARVNDAARMLGLESLLSRRPDELSGGERQRVALGRAMARRPAVYLFDEPLSNLDTPLRAELRRELRRLHESLMTTTVYVTHDQVEALTLGQRIAVMNAGQIQQIGGPQEIYDWPANRFVAGFIGSPAMSFVEGDIEPLAGGAVWRFRPGEHAAEPTAVDLTGRKLDFGSAEPRGLCSRRAVLGVRPEDVRLAKPGPAEAAGFDGVIESVERLGDAILVTTRLSTQDTAIRNAAARNAAIVSTDSESGSHNTASASVVTKLGPRSVWQVGERVRMTVEPGRWHLFDPLTGENWVQP